MFSSSKPKVATVTAQKPAVSATETMRAVEFHGTRDVRVNSKRPKPLVTEPTDVIVRLTCVTICGSDLHLYHNAVPGMEKGDILGHEGVGIVDSVGTSITKFKVGDRVVISAVIACGECEYCKQQMFSLCDRTNPSKEMEEMYGHRIAGLFGYTHLTGGYDGTQADYVRVPIAEVNLLKIPSELDSYRAILLSDVANAGWHANELGEVKLGSIVAVWGCGPVGLMTQIWAWHRGATRVIGIDCVPKRLEKAKTIGSEIIDTTETPDVVARMRELLPGGPDVCIDTVGYRYTKTVTHTIQKAVGIETDSVDIITEATKCVKKGGKLAVIGDYFGLANGFPIGALVEKGVTMRGGQLFAQKYWHTLLEKFLKDEVKPNPGIFLFTHEMDLDNAPIAYDVFDKKEDGVVKILLWVDKSAKHPASAK